MWDRTAVCGRSGPALRKGREALCARTTIARYGQARRVLASRPLAGQTQTSSVLRQRKNASVARTAAEPLRLPARTLPLWGSTKRATVHPCPRDVATDVAGGQCAGEIPEPQKACPLQCRAHEWRRADASDIGNAADVLARHGCSSLSAATESVGWALDRRRMWERAILCARARYSGKDFCWGAGARRADRCRKMCAPVARPSLTVNDLVLCAPIPTSTPRKQSRRDRTASLTDSGNNRRP
ncbi:hypothetical protein OBBRIDRAFT_162614 [Obba rivulosa]|uniref:Uncharacterized protein n=1 Tax=Obba rivulosa TaxID=1052685 RepID=A0A8E2J482_9APHY|nr:hypothetical protein OBBRIDRAFT_162614 [Obba rivulosa]